MINEEEVHCRVEWRVRVDNGLSEILVPEIGQFRQAWLWIISAILELKQKILKFLNKAWVVGLDDPRKFIHCIKVGTALTFVSLFYYMRPLYQGVGGNAMWAVLTVVVVFEFSVGATLYKSFNRATGTFLAGTAALGVHWVASQCGENFEPIILRTSIFLLAAAATFSRFIPTVKARFDYGAMIFILTFSLVSVSGYRVDDLFKMAHERLLTVLIGASMCILVSIIVCPVWAGQDLDLLITRNMEKLANSFDGCVSEYFKEDTSGIDNTEESGKKLQGYKCLLNSKASEESLANFARWEPNHGQFNFRHPWKQYLKVGASMRNCAYCIETLIGCINTEIQAPDFIKKHVSDACMRLSSHSSTVLKELAINIKTMKKSSTIDITIAEMYCAVVDLQNVLKSLPTQLSSPQLSVVEPPVNEKTNPISTMTIVPLVEVLSLVTVASLLIEITSRIEGVVNAVEELAGLADFKVADEIMKYSLDHQGHEV
ncbi:hypothetical protein GIB67_001613 [Kingdonia uniflora]|uniref:Aluminum-activated malate transporter 10 n=1 Tax=Kingdonia uniflora TaxID=39325 RepID=A0A7J7L0Y3_9MAGN|nr:hypothetical protein GIB67_001613 [Kingdonia uniflora]